MGGGREVKRGLGEELGRKGVGLVLVLLVLGFDGPLRSGNDGNWVN